MHANCTFRQCSFKVFVAIEVAVVLSVFLHEVSLLCVRISTIIISFSILLSLKGSTKQSFLLESRHFLLLHVSAITMHFIFHKHCDWGDAFSVLHFWILCFSFVNTEHMPPECLDVPYLECVLMPLGHCHTPSILHWCVSPLSFFWQITGSALIQHSR